MTETETVQEDDEPVPPLTRGGGLMDGLITCADCGEKLVSITDSRGVGFYVHEADAPKIQD